jgi:hypothetical protein
MGSSSILMMCSRLKKAEITMDIPADVDYDEQLTRFIQARRESGFPLSSLDVDVCRYTDSQAAAGGTCQALEHCGRSCCILCGFGE